MDGAGPRAADAVLKLHPALDPDAYAPIFRRFGRLHVPGFLTPESTASLSRTMAEATGWLRSVPMQGNEAADIPIDQLEELTAVQREGLQHAVHQTARDSFGFSFDTIRLTSDALQGRPVNAALRPAMEMVNSAPFLDFIRRLTGDPRPVFCDAMATRFLPGHFITAHEDEHVERQRLYAYVLNLTPRWRADWGGLLLFLDEEDHVAEGYVPAFGALNVFRVPQRHSVSLVTPFAGGARLSLTGWVRSAVPAGWKG